MFSAFTMTLTTHGIREGSKEDRTDEAKVKEREKGKEKAEEEKYSSDQGKEKAKERRKGRSHMVSEEGYDMKNGMKEMNGMTPTTAFGPMIKPK